jgi:hypothetical protein
MNLFFRMQLPMEAKHSPPIKAEPVEYISQLSATNEDCLIFYWRQILKIRFSNTWWGNDLSWLIKVLRKGCFHNGPVMCPRSVILMALEVKCIVPRRCLGPIQTHWAIITDLGHITGPLWKYPFINTIIISRFRNDIFDCPFGIL